jgi:hypothetical protein
MVGFESPVNESIRTAQVFPRVEGPVDLFSREERAHMRIRQDSLAETFS